jgi:hypothetical protein
MAAAPAVSGGELGDRAGNGLGNGERVGESSDGLRDSCAVLGNSTSSPTYDAPAKWVISGEVRNEARAVD